MTSFNLGSESWISCRSNSGELVQLSLREVFQRAPELSGLANESPLIDAAIFRLLLTILHANFGPADDLAWEALWSAGKFDMAKLDAYFDKWRHRFDLFHTETPFYQVGKLIEQTPNYANGKKPARELIAEQSSYGAPRELFESRPEDHAAPISAARAARWLLAIQAFHPGGLLSRDTKNGDPTAAKSGLVCSSAVVTVQANTLFESLVMNLVNYPSDLFPSSSKDRPAWEQPPLERYKSRPCLGLMDWYTWQSRRIQLLPNDGGDVEHVIVLAGHEVADDNRMDPMCAFTTDPKLGPSPVGFSVDRALWRDSAALYQVNRQRDFVAPLVVQHFAARRSAHQQTLRLRVDGQVPKKASIILTRSEVLPLPIEVIEQPLLIGCIQEEITRCEEAQGALRGALFYALSKVLSIGERDPDTKDVRGLIEETQAIPRYWAELKEPFDRFLENLPKDDEAAALTFREAIRRIALQRYESAVTASSSSSRVLKGLVLGQTTLLIGLAKCGLAASNFNKETKATSPEVTA